MGPIIFFLFALAFFIFPLATVSYIEKVKRKGIRVDGIVDKIEIYDDGESSSRTLYVKFTTKSDIVIFGKYSYASEKYIVGQLCKISYLPKKPENFIIVESDEQYLGYYIFTLPTD